MSDTHLSPLITSSPVEVTAADTAIEFMEQVDHVEPFEEDGKSKEVVVAQDKLIFSPSGIFDDLGPNLPLSCSPAKEVVKETTPVTVEVMESVKPIDPMEDVKVVELNDSVERLEPVEHVNTVEGVNTLEPMEPLEPVEHVNTLEVVNTLEPMEPLEPVELMESVEPLTTVEPIKPVEPLKTMEPIEPAEPLMMISFPEVGKLSSNKKKPTSRGRKVHWVTDDQLPHMGRHSFELSTSKIYRRERRERMEAMKAAYNKTAGNGYGLSTEKDEQNSSVGVDGATIDGIGATSAPTKKPFRIPKKKNFISTKKVGKKSPDPAVSPVIVNDESPRIKMAKKRERPIDNPGVDVQDTFLKIKMEKKSEQPIDDLNMEVNDTLSRIKMEKKSEQPIDDSNMEVNDTLSLSRIKMENEPDLQIKDLGMEVNDTLSKMENEFERDIAGSGMEMNDTVSKIKMDKEPDQVVDGPDVEVNDSFQRMEEHIGLEESRNYSNYDRPAVSPSWPSRNYFLRQDIRRKEDDTERVPTLSKIKMENKPDLHIDGPIMEKNDPLPKIRTSEELERDIDAPDMEANGSLHKMVEPVSLDESRNYSNYDRRAVSPIRPRRNLFLRQDTRRQENNVERIPIYRADDIRQQPLQRENRGWGRRPNYDSYFNRSRSSSRDERQDSSRNDNAGSSSRSRSNSRS